MTTTSTKERITSVQNVASYPTPGIIASYQGRVVRLVALGDSPGHSPVCQFVTSEGQLEWASQSEFIVSDPAILPPSRETMQHLLTQTNQQERNQQTQSNR